MKCKLLLTLFLSFTAQAKSLSPYPVTITNCGNTMTFEKAPEKAVFNDLNMVQMALALDLQPHMAAVTGVSGWYKTTPEYKQALGNIPELAPRYLSLEALLTAEPDFLFAGWNYGLRVGTELTPENFARFGVKTLVLSESCAHVRNNLPSANMDLLYNDVLNLGKIFNKNAQAEQLIRDWQSKLATIAAKTQNLTKKKVFLFDSGVDKPFTSGRLAMPQALISAAGGKNIMSDSDFSWRATSWEQVAMHDPDLIVLVDYNADGAMGPGQLIDALKVNPLMKQTKAVQNDQFLLLNYGEITPGPDNIASIEKIAQALYPEAEI